MARLLLNDYGVFLGLKRGYFYVKKGNDKATFAPSQIEQIIVLTGGASISSAAIRQALKFNIPISFHLSDGRFLGMIKRIGSANVLLRKKQYEARLNEKGIEIARKVAMAKVYNQRSILSQYLRSKDLDDEKKNEIQDAISKMGYYIEEIKKLYLQSDIIKAEAEAAKLYWNCFKYFVKAEFKGRKKRFDEPKDPVNICLNYGYSILGSQVWHAVELKGLDPYAGFLHVDNPRRPALVMDLMEEFRQVVVDRVVIRFINSLDNFNITEKGFLKREYRKKLVTMIFQRLEEKITFEERRMPIISHIHNQVTKLAEFLMDRRKNYTPFLEK